MNTLSPSTARVLPGSPREAPVYTDLAGWRDALVWLVISAAILTILPIGTLSGDGIAQSAAYARGAWEWNPNHLLLEPLGAWWQATLTQLGSTRIGPDQLKILSILAGAIAVALFRWGVAGELASSRLAANHGTLWMALSSAFSRLWISDETHMVQLPALVLASVATVQYLRRPSATRAAIIGACVGLAGLFYVSNVVLAATLVVLISLLLWVRGRQKEIFPFTAAMGGGVLAVAGLGFLLAWVVIAPAGAGFLDWMTAYSGGTVSERVADSYGVELSFAAIAVATARALYGGASALVDLAPVVEVFRDGLRPSFRTWANLVAFASAGVLMVVCLLRLVRRGPDQVRSSGLVITLAWLTAVLGFGIYWNNSDDQFYFQLAIAFGALAATLPFRPRSRSLVVLGLLSLTALAWNGFALGELIFYPRAERVAALDATTEGAGLVVFPGMDEVNQLLTLVPSDEGRQTLALTALASGYSAEEGLDTLAARVRATLATGRRVDVIAVFDVPSDRNPWKALRGYGYEQASVVSLLEPMTQEKVSRYAGPFTVRSIHPTSTAPR